MQNESGRTMLEMLGVLAIMGIITYGAIAGINYGMSSYKINQCYSEVQDIIQGIEDLYSWSKTYPDQESMMNAACKNDVFAQPCTDGNTKGKGAFGEIIISPINGGDNFQVCIHLSDSGECQRLTNMDWAGANIKCSNPNGGGNCTCDKPTGANASDSIALFFSPK